jgi:hypothetical protein
MSLNRTESGSINNKNTSENTYIRCRMRRNHVIVIVAIVLILLVGAVAAILAFTLRSSPIAIRIEPENVGRLTFGDTFTVNVTVENCVNVLAVQVDLRYDPTVLNVTNIVEGPFLPSVRQTILVKNTTSTNTDTPPRTAGVYFVNSLMGGGNGTDANGNGVLITITFKVVGGGSTDLQFFSYKPGGTTPEGTYFADRSATAIIPELHNGSYGGSP